MKNHGGYFVRRRAQAWLAGDDDKRARLESAWPELFAKYADIAAQTKEQAQL
jgi:hypothetical protein